MRNIIPDVLVTDRTQFLTDLTQFEVGLRKHQLIHNMTAREIELYGEEKGRIAKDLEKSAAELVDLKGQLTAAQIVRANKLQYDDLARKINVYATRKKSTDNATRLRTKIQETIAKTDAIRRKREHRRKHLLTIVTAIHELQDTIKEDKEQDDARSIDDMYADDVPPPPTPPQEEEEEGVLEEEKFAMDVA
ncbi:THO complex subunit 7 [Thoreauomyces humboldtii]|nr:THO complex subunit 7 [Thoreauomyces humboldtii]